MNLANGPESPLLPLMPCHLCEVRFAVRQRTMCAQCEAACDMYLDAHIHWEEAGCE